MRVILVVLMSCGLATSGLSQGSGAQPRAPRQHEATIDVEFPGGTLADFVEVLRRTSGLVNIVYHPKPPAVRVPPLVLKRVTVGVALETVCLLLDPEVVCRSRELRDPDGDSVYLVRIVQRYVEAPPPPRGLKVLSLRHLLGRRGAADKPIDTAMILTAIETGLELARLEGAPADLKFHPDTGLLFVFGTPAQVDVVEQVVERLRRDVVEGSSQPRPQTPGRRREGGGEDRNPKERRDR